jgi:DNA-binding response OmpR family regulator
MVVARKILIADDDAPTRFLLRAAVGQWGYETVEAKDGVEAWDIMQNDNSPRLLILDWIMPRLTGVDLCQKIKNELKKNVFIILLTQQSGTNNIAKGLDSGADEFLTKPFNMAELKSRLSIGARVIGNEQVASNDNMQWQDAIKIIELEMGKIAEKIDIMQEEYQNKTTVTKLEDQLEQSRFQFYGKIQSLKKDINHVIHIIKKCRSNHQ